MTHSVLACRQTDPVFPRYADGIHQLRYRTFHERLRWQVQCHNGREIDRFDDEKTVYLITRDETDQVVGGWRLRPSTEPNMLRDIFPQLMHGAAVPAAPHIWEISRFAFDRNAITRSAFGFGDTTRDLLAETARFAWHHGIDQFILVVSTAVERLLRNTGIKLQRFGEPVQIGEVRTVACSLEMNDHTRLALLGAQETARLAQRAA